MADEKPTTLSIRLPADVVQSARVVASLEDITIVDLVSDILRPILRAREDAALRHRIATRDAKAIPPPGNAP